MLTIVVAILDAKYTGWSPGLVYVAAFLLDCMLIEGLFT